MVLIFNNIFVSHITKAHISIYIIQFFHLNVQIMRGNTLFTNKWFIKSNQENQGYSGNLKNKIQGQKPDMENRHTQQRT